MNRPSVLVTGAGGFIGRAVAQSLFLHGHRVIAIVSPRVKECVTIASKVCRFEFPDADFRHLIAQEQPDWLFHCAGSSSVSASVQNPAKDWRTNVAATASIYAQLARHSPETRVIFTSSAAVYGQPFQFPITESTPIAPISPYGRHKRAGECMGEILNEYTGIPVTNLRIFSAYGPGLAKQVLWDIYQKSKLSSPVTLEGDGTETRDFVYVDDVVEVVNRIVSSPLPGFNVLNVASGISVDIASLARQFLECLGVKRDIRFTGHRSSGVPAQWTVDIGLLQRHLGAPKTKLTDGLQKYSEWLRYREGEDDARSILAAAG